MASVIVSTVDDHELQERVGATLQRPLISVARLQSSGAGGARTHDLTDHEGTFQGQASGAGAAARCGGHPGRFGDVLAGGLSLWSTRRRAVGDRLVVLRERGSTAPGTAASSGGVRMQRLVVRSRCSSRGRHGHAGAQGRRRGAAQPRRSASSGSSRRSGATRRSPGCRASRRSRSSPIPRGSTTPSDSRTTPTTTGACSRSSATSSEIHARRTGMSVSNASSQRPLRPRMTDRPCEDVMNSAKTWRRQTVGQFVGSAADDGRAFRVSAGRIGGRGRVRTCDRSGVSRVLSR